MRKIYSFMAFALLSLVSLTASAWSYNMSSENDVLQGEGFNYRAYKVYNFFGGQFNDAPFTDEAGNTVSGDGCFGVAADAASFKLNGFAAYQVQSPAQMSNFFIQIGTGAINLRAGVSKDGLHNYGSGSRFFAISDVKAGQIIVCQWGVTSSRASVVQPASNITDATPCEFEDLTDSIHALQDALAAQAGEGGEGEEGEAAPTHDNFSYWRATSDGYFVIEMQRDCCIQGLQIWIDASAQEAVSAPSLKIVGVNGTNRDLEFKAGESTFGSPVSTYYSKDGSDPIYLKDSEVVDKVTYIYEQDEEGNYVLDADSNRVVADSLVTYVKVLDTDAVEEFGDYGDNKYDGSGSITIFSDDDEDGDGIVTVKAASVSETGIVSSVVTINVSVGAITLNAPTFTLQGFDGLSRTYSINWSNNTICGEPFSFKVEGTGADAELYSEDLTVGGTINVSEGATVTVSAPGYTDGVGTLEADMQGVSINRKAEKTQDEEGNVLHDWDFTILTEEQAKILRGEVVEAYYIWTADSDSIACSYADYIANDGFVNDIDFTEGTPVYAATAWSWDASRGRATLKTDTLGVNRNSNNWGYWEDNANIVQNMTVSCPPNAKNASCIMMYIATADAIGPLGIYFMAKPTLMFPRSSVAAGEYLLVYQGQGGSNYTNSRWPTIYQAPEGELLSITLAGNGIHVFYMDVYTYADLPTDAIEDPEQAYEDLVPVQNVESANVVVPVAYYSLSGAKLDAPQKGINIVVFSNGATGKTLVK